MTKHLYWLSVLVAIMAVLALPALTGCDTLLGSDDDDNDIGSNPGHLGESFMLPAGEISDLPVDAEAVAPLVNPPGGPEKTQDKVLEEAELDNNSFPGSEVICAAILNFIP
ncbi:MAG: hypothetical protein EA404_08840 [Spirochaetaceae bacterium]|nr:MAG: hypothetical protein EA404_08840 [Spirochaetaceae bacterium]